MNMDLSSKDWAGVTNEEISSSSGLWALLFSLWILLELDSPGSPCVDVYSEFLHTQTSSSPGTRLQQEPVKPQPGMGSMVALASSEGGGHEEPKASPSIGES
ncbi:hypothetical protein TURU_140253 [Turdus rufiventris]|nr:hypothetical protein TURU_140253 [Turdus rufiventris]